MFVTGLFLSLVTFVPPGHDWLSDSTGIMYDGKYFQPNYFRSGTTEFVQKYLSWGYLRGEFRVHVSCSHGQRSKPVSLGCDDHYVILF